MLGRLLAAISPANTPHGYNLTFAFPMLLFIIVAGALYLRFRSPHKVPGHEPTAVSQAPGPAGRPVSGQAPAPAGQADGGVADGGVADGGAAAGDADGPDEAAADTTEPGA